MAWHAPWPRLGVVGYAASPGNVVAFPRLSPSGSRCGEAGETQLLHEARVVAEHELAGTCGAEGGPDGLRAEPLDELAHPTVASLSERDVLAANPVGIGKQRVHSVDGDELLRDGVADAAEVAFSAEESNREG
jgi:hypothetical protein